MHTPNIVDLSLPHSVLRFCNNYHSLFCDTLTPHPRAHYHDRVLLNIEQLTNIPLQLEEGAIETVRR